MLHVSIWWFFSNAVAAVLTISPNAMNIRIIMRNKSLIIKWVSYVHLLLYGCSYGNMNLVKILSYNSHFNVIAILSIKLPIWPKLTIFEGKIGLTTAELTILWPQYSQNRVSNNQLLLLIYWLQITVGNGKSNLLPVTVYRR